MTNKPRPIAVALISWFYIITSGISLLFVPFTANNPVFEQSFRAFSVSSETVILLNVISSGTNVTCGVAMFIGKRWGRQIYFVLTPLLMLASMALYNFKMPLMFLLGFVMYGAFVILLTRPSVNTFFSAQASLAPPSPTNTAENIVRSSLDGKKIASIALLVPGGFILMGSFMVIIPLSNTPLALLMVGTLFGIFACAFIIPAVFLWGRGRWAILLGTFLMSVGGMLLMSSLGMYQVSSLPEFQIQFSKVDPDFLDQMTRSCLIFGIGALISGGLLVLLQRVTDQPSKPNETLPQA